MATAQLKCLYIFINSKSHLNLNYNSHDIIFNNPGAIGIEKLKKS